MTSSSGTSPSAARSARRCASRSTVRPSSTSGAASPTRDGPWERDTIGVVWSCTKGATALCAHMLRGARRARPRRAGCGVLAGVRQERQGSITVRMLLEPPGRARRVAGADARLGLLRLGAHRRTRWARGSRCGSRARATGTTRSTFGHLIGEVVRRVTGGHSARSSAPRSASRSGSTSGSASPRATKHRVAPTIPADLPGPGDAIPSFYLVALTDPASIPAMVVMHSGLASGARLQSTAAGARGRDPGLRRHRQRTRARARMYRVLALGGAVDGVQLVDAEELGAMGAVASATALDATMHVPTRWSLGFCKSVDNRRRDPGDAGRRHHVGGSVRTCGYGRITRFRQPTRSHVLRLHDEPPGTLGRARRARPVARRRDVPVTRLPRTRTRRSWYV